MLSNMNLWHNMNNSPFIDANINYNSLANKVALMAEAKDGVGTDIDGFTNKTGS